MTFRVKFTDEFTADINGHIDYLFSQDVAFHTVDAWYGRLSLG